MKAHDLDIRRRSERLAASFARTVNGEIELQGLRKADVAKRMKVTRSNLYAHLTGKKPLTMSTMAKFERALGVRFLIAITMPISLEARREKRPSRRRLRRRSRA